MTKEILSICMIIKNEDKILDKCLQSLIPYGYEIFIADTGSTDRSKEIALNYTNNVMDYRWNHDFAAARNFVIGRATSEYVLLIDSDEIVTSFDKNELESLISKNPKAIGRLLRINDYTRGQEQFSARERVSRLFSKQEYQYEGIIHEQVVHKRGLQNIFYDIPIEMHHKGYDGDVSIRSKKAERNIILLKQELKAKGDDPYVLYQLGKSYYMQEDYLTSSEWFDKALNFDLDAHLEYVQDLVESYGYSLINTKKYDAAMQLLKVYDEFAVNADFIYLMGLIYMNNAKFNEAITEFIKASKTKEYKIDGVNSYRAFYNIGVIYECLGNTAQAKEYYSKCGEYKPAKIRQNCL